MSIDEVLKKLRPYGAYFLFVDRSEDITHYHEEGKSGGILVLKNQISKCPSNEGVFHVVTKYENIKYITCNNKNTILVKDGSNMEEIETVVRNLFQ